MADLHGRSDSAHVQALSSLRPEQQQVLRVAAGIPGTVTILSSSSVTKASVDWRVRDQGGTDSGCDRCLPVRRLAVGLRPSITQGIRAVVIFSNCG